jgi:transposase InsO family protein
MTTQMKKVTRRKLSLLELAGELQNVSKACRIMGYSRQQFYEIRRNYQLYGAEGLIDKLPGTRSPHPNRVSDEVEQAILGYSLVHPTHGCLKVSQQLALRDIRVSSTGVRGVWSRNGLESKMERLLRLEKAARDRVIELTEEQIRSLERFNPEFKERHIETRRPGDPLSVDTFYVGSLKGIGKVYMQSALDCFSRYAWGRLYTSKLPITAVHTLNDAVLPFFEAHGVAITTVLSDNGREFCGRMDAHPYELFLQIEEIEHTTTRVGRPQSNGFIERFHRTVLDEHFRVAGRTKWYESIEEMQTDLDRYLELYNTQRSHQGYHMNGRTPYQAFIDGINLEPIAAEEEEVKEAA